MLKKNAEKKQGDKNQQYHFSPCYNKEENL